MHPIDRLEIDTPEQIALELPLAGVGSRCLALVVDTLLQILLYFLAVLALSVLGRLGGYTIVRWLSGCVAPVLVVLFLFCLYWGYFAFFETVWAGQTPGKRVARIRVIKESGRPVNVFEAIGRNLVRVVDFLPAFYGAGLVCMLVDKRNRRLGDFVAGTVVVHERRGDEVVQPYADSRPAMRGTSEVTADVARLAREDLVLIETYLSRRQDLDAVIQLKMAGDIAARIRARAGLERGADESDNDFLEAVARRIRENARF
jgi:uncharacterized RDD family membrane protein YckC